MQKKCIPKKGDRLQMSLICMGLEERKFLVYFKICPHFKKPN